MSHIFRMCCLIRSIVYWHVFSSAIPISFVSLYKRYCWYSSKNLQQRDFCNVGGFRLDTEMGVACAVPKCHLHQWPLPVRSQQHRNVKLFSWRESIFLPFLNLYSKFHECMTEILKGNYEDNRGEKLGIFIVEQVLPGYWRSSFFNWLPRKAE